MAYQSRVDARFSTYSGAPSLQPSLAPTFDSQTNSNRCSQHQHTLSSSPTTRPLTHLSTTPLAMCDDEKLQLHHHDSTLYTNANAQMSSSTIASTDPKMQDIKAWADGFNRMQDARFDKQRYVMSGNKKDEVGKLALGAKVERALGRRMTGQDATFTKKQANEKQLEVKVQ